MLDLWGLASYEALKTRLDNPYQGWAADLVRDSDVELAMVYDEWIDQGLGSDWVKVGKLQYTGNYAFLGGGEVSFYATTPAAADEIRAKIKSFSPRVQGKARLIVVEDQE